MVSHPSPNLCIPEMILLKDFGVLTWTTRKMWKMWKHHHIEGFETRTPIDLRESQQALILTRSIGHNMTS